MDKLFARQKPGGNKGKTREALEGEIRDLSLKLKKTMAALAESQTQLEVHKKRTTQMLSAWKKRVQECERRIRTMRMERDRNLQQLASQLMFLEENLKKDQKQIKSVLSEKNSLISEQHAKITQLESTHLKLQREIDSLQRAQSKPVFDMQEVRTNELTGAGNIWPFTESVKQSGDWWVSNDNLVNSYPESNSNSAIYRSTSMPNIKGKGATPKNKSVRRPYGSQENILDTRPMPDILQSVANENSKTKPSQSKPSHTDTDSYAQDNVFTDTPLADSNSTVHEFVRIHSASDILDQQNTPNLIKRTPKMTPRSVKQRHKSRSRSRSSPSLVTPSPGATGSEPRQILIGGKPVLTFAF